VDRMKALIKGKIGREIISLGTVDSTNTLAAELCEKNAPHGTVVIAERQTKGRGRLGRTWVSAGGNIHMSIVLRPSMASAGGTLLTMIASVACARALIEASGLPVGIKWPNDIMVSGKKLGGVLTEVKSMGDRIISAVIGIGINVNSDMEEFPPEVKTTATSLKAETSIVYSKTLLISRILNEVEFWYDELTGSGREKLLREWRRLSCTLGREVVVSTSLESFHGVAQDIDEGGALIVKLPAGGLRRVSAGDLTILR
jgi:BirA family biotin operon repressor/biotin-[acetyl-CoA-carboxylase] ligase